MVTLEACTQIPGKTVVVMLGRADPWGDVDTYTGGHVSIPQFLPVVQLSYLEFAACFGLLYGIEVPQQHMATSPCLAGTQENEVVVSLCSR